MSVMIYIMIIILFLIFIFWTWNNTKSFEGTFTRVSYIIIGTLFISITTFIIFIISKNNINYPNQDMIGVVRNIILLVFVPINGFIILPQIASTIGKIKNDDITAEKLKKRIVIFIIAIIIIVIFEGYYFKNIQNGIIQIINLK